MSKEKILLVQPHSDDILFSASKYLMNRSDYGDITLLTVEKDEKRNKEDEELAELFGIKYKHLNSLIEDKSYYHYYKDNKKKVFDFDDCGDLLIDILGQEKIDEISSELKSVVKKYKKKGYKIVCCLGVGHPMHWFVRMTIEKYIDIYYRDFPHSYKRKTAECIKTIPKYYKLVESYQNSEENHLLKWDIAKKVYKTQSSLLWFEQGYIRKNLPEEYYEKV